MKLICREGDVNLTKDNFVYAESELHYVGIWAVSYTHLDVYKRQVVGNFLLCIISPKQ